MHVTGKKLGSVVSGAAVLAGLGIVSTPAMSTAAASATSVGWHCTHGKSTHDGDAGGSSGWVDRKWKGTDALVEGRFAANDEKFGVINLTTAKVTGTLYVKGGNAGGYYAFDTIRLAAGHTGDWPSKVHDLSLSEGTRVYIRVSIHNRGHCTSPKFTA